MQNILGYVIYNRHKDIKDPGFDAVVPTQEFANEVFRLFQNPNLLESFSSYRKMMLAVNIISPCERPELRPEDWINYMGSPFKCTCKFWAVKHVCGHDIAVGLCRAETREIYKAVCPEAAKDRSLVGGKRAAGRPHKDRTRALEFQSNL